MARNQLSLAHNGNADSPERLFLLPTQGENWLGAGCSFPNPKQWKRAGEVQTLPLSSLSLPGAIYSAAHTLLKQVTQTGLTSCIHTHGAQATCKAQQT